jgi:hypothetical protein
MGYLDEHQEIAAKRPRGHVFHRPNIGSITQGINKASILADTFICELRKQKPLHDKHRAMLARTEYQRTPLAELVPQLIIALNDYAPEGYYFGPSTSDDSDFGFWPITADA